MTDHDIGAIAAEMLKKRLPGFETKIDGGRYSVVIHGALPIASRVSAEAIIYPIYDSRFSPEPSGIARALRDATETDDMRAVREAKERAAIELAIEPSIARIDDTIKRFGIEALGLEAWITEREARAREAGKREGFAAGHAAGMAQGRREILAELDAIRRIRDELGD